EAVAIARLESEKNPNDGWWRGALATALDGRMQIRRAAGDMAGALGDLREAIKARESILGPDDIDGHREILTWLDVEETLEWDAKDPELAATCEHAIRIGEALVARDVKETGVRAKLGKAHCTLGL